MVGLWEGPRSPGQLAAPVYGHLLITYMLVPAKDSRATATATSDSPGLFSASIIARNHQHPVARALRPMARALRLLACTSTRLENRAAACFAVQRQPVFTYQLGRG